MSSLGTPVRKGGEDVTAQGRDLIERATALAWRHEQEITAGLSANDRKARLDALSLVFRNLKRPG
ncbi:hypothetical protein [Ferrimicrobium acidiphilum]|uniref:hypothetical protein n=1 Tax=Ferrimicrobium acidiphilum TaxID=121039 RepID=UPI0023F4AE50|nr:hypothetical protein [Ferrimicrobium acidiphilum]